MILFTILAIFAVLYGLYKLGQATVPEAEIIRQWRREEAERLHRGCNHHGPEDIH
jgi:hypothetical protein